MCWVAQFTVAVINCRLLGVLNPDGAPTVRKVVPAATGSVFDAPVVVLKFPPGLVLANPVGTSVIVLVSVAKLEPGG